MLGFVQKALGGGFPASWLGGWTGGSLSSFLEALRGNMADTVTDPLRQHVWVYACVRARARALGSTPLVLRRGPDEDDRVIETGDLVSLFQSPHPMVTSQRLWQLHSAYYDVFGCVHWLLYEKSGSKLVPVTAGMADEIRVPAELVPVPGPVLDVIEDPVTRLPAAYELKTGGGVDRFGPGGVVTFRDISGGSLLGSIGAVEALQRRILADFAAESLDIHATQNGGLPSLLFSSPDLLHDTNLEQMRADLAKWVGNPDRHQMPALLHGGLKLENSAFSPRDMENLAMRTWSRDAIMAVLGVTKPILGITDDVNRANAREAKAVFWEETLIPQQQLWLSDVQVFLNRVQGEDAYAGFDLSGVEALGDSLDEKIQRTLELHREAGLPLEVAADLVGWAIDPAKLEEAAGNVVDEASVKPDATLNGAQMAQLREVITAVGAGEVPREAAVQIINVSLPVSEDRARRMLESVEEGSTPRNTAPSFGEPQGEEGDEDGEVPPEFERSIPSRDRALRAPMDRATRRSVQRTFEAFLEPRESRMERAVADVQRGYVQATQTKVRQVADGQRAFRPRHPEVAMRALEDDVPPELLDEIERLLLPTLTAWQDRMSDAVGPLLREFYFDGLADMAADLGVTDILSDTDANSLAFLSTRTIDLAEGSMETLQRELRDAIARTMFEHGGTYTVADVQNRLRDSLAAVEDKLDEKAGNIDVRAQRIARTETAGAVNQARFAEMAHLGLTRHQWTTASDIHVRDSHASVDGEVRVLGEPFSNGLLHPNDFDAPVSEIINCRCSAWPVDEDVEAVLSEDDDA